MNLSENVIAMFNKAFIAVSTLNVGVWFFALIGVVSDLAPVVTVAFAVWVGRLAVREKRLSIQNKKKEKEALDLDIKLKRRKWMSDSSNE